MRDILRLVPNADPTTGSTSQNAADQVGHGLELEAQWSPLKALALSGNYAYQRSTDQAMHQDAGNAPHHHLYVRADWRYAPSWQVEAQLNWVADRKRESGDNRPQISDYHSVDLTWHSDRGHAK